jgi:hypothetical protein
MLLERAQKEKAGRVEGGSLNASSRAYKTRPKKKAETLAVSAFECRLRGSTAWF